MLWLALTTVAAQATASLTLRPLNVTLSDQDSVLRYDPPAASFVNRSLVATPPHQGWNLSYSQLAPWSMARFGKGQSSHTTQLAGANVTLDATATDMYFWGSMTDDAELRLDIDGKSTIFSSSAAAPQFPDGPANVTLLASMTGLELGEHTAVLTLQKGQVTLNNVIFTTAIQTEAADATMSDVSEVFTVLEGSTKNGEFVAKSGGWAAIWDMCNAPDYVTGECPNRMPRVTTWDEDAQLEWTTPVNASFMELITLNDHNGAAYIVQVSPPLGSSPETTFRSSIMSPFMGANNTIFQAPLDPSVTYTITLTRPGPKEDPNPTYMSLHSVRYRLSTCKTCSDQEKNGAISLQSSSATSVSGPLSTSSVPEPQAHSSSTKSNTGAIAGGVIGGVVVLCLIIAGVLFWRRRRTKREKSVIDKETPETDHIVKPFQSTTFLKSPHHTDSVGRTASGVSPTTTDNPSFSSPISSTPAAGTRHNFGEGNGPSPAYTQSQTSSGTAPLTDNKSTYRPTPPAHLSPGQAATSTLDSPVSPTPAIDAAPLVLEQEDAGRIVEWVPPRYNARWRSERDSDGASTYRD